MLRLKKPNIEDIIVIRTGQLPWKKMSYYGFFGSEKARSEPELIKGYDATGLRMIDWLILGFMLKHANSYEASRRNTLIDSISQAYEITAQKVEESFDDMHERGLIETIIVGLKKKDEIITSTRYRVVKIRSIFIPHLEQRYVESIEDENKMENKTLGKDDVVW